jgi:Bacterial Ig domain
VTQPPNGSVSFSPIDVTYTPDPGFGSGSDTFQYTISDGNGGSDTATVTVTMVDVTGFTVERQQPDGTWMIAPSGEISSSEDNLRWTAQYSPSNPPIASEVHWLMKPWAERDNPGVPWTTFGLTPCDCPAEENPGAGEWAIKAEVHFNDVPEQSEFVVAMQEPESKLIMEVLSVEWVGHDPGDGQTNLSPNPETGGGSRIFPGRNSIEGSAPDHRRVDFKVTVKPALLNLPVQITWKDPDDPTDSNGPIDTDPGDLTDNKIAGLNNVPSEVLTTAIVGNTAIATGSVQVPFRYPGDNFRLVAGVLSTDFGKIKAISIGDDPGTPLVEGETEGRVFLDRNDDGDQDAGEPVIQEEGPATYIASPLLTIWRKVWVEVDSMGNVTAGDPNDDAGDDHTPLTGDVPSPDTSEMAGAYEDAFIQIKPTTDPDVSEGSLPFQASFATEADMLIYAGNHRQTPETADFWSVYLLGIYEYGAFAANRDNDVNSEFALMGFTNMPAQNPTGDYSFIPMEIVADVADQWGWDEDQKETVQQVLAVHESGHQFQLVHTAQYPEHVMTAPNSDADEAQAPQVQLVFTEDDIERIRKRLPSTGP